jgi:hypothetical protein
MGTPVNQRVQKRRDALRAAGMRPVQVWVPDTRRPGFREEARRQALLAAASDAKDEELLRFIDAVVEDALSDDK